MVCSLSIHNTSNSKDIHVCTDNNNCHECWLTHSDSKAVDCKTHYDFMNVKYVKTLCLGINEVVLTSLFMANRIFPCVLTLCFLLNYFSSIILSDYKTCNKSFPSVLFSFFVSSYLWFSYQPISPNFTKSS